MGQHGSPATHQWNTIEGDGALQKHEECTLRNEANQLPVIHGYPHFECDDFCSNDSNVYFLVIEKSRLHKHTWIILDSFASYTFHYISGTLLWSTLINFNVIGAIQGQAGNLCHGCLLVPQTVCRWEVNRPCFFPQNGLNTFKNHQNMISWHWHG